MRNCVILLMWLILAQCSELCSETLIEKGLLLSSEKVKVMTPLSGRFLFLIEDGTWVKTGDLVAEIDLGEIDERGEQIEQEIEDLKADIKFQETLRNQCLSTHKRSEKLDQFEYAYAQKELKTLLDGAEKKDIKIAEIQLEQAIAELDKESDAMSRQQNLVDKGFTSEASLEPYKIRLRSKELKVEAKRRAIATLKEPPKEEEVKALEAEVHRWLGYIERSRERKERKLKEIDLNTDAMILDLEQKTKSYQDNRKESSQGKIYSPCKGLLRLTQRRDWAQGGIYVAMNSGTKVWERDVIAEVEDTNSVKVQLTIHESDVSKLHMNMPVELSIPALDNKSFSGVITQVSALGMDLQDLVPVGDMEVQHGQAFFRFMVQVNEKDDRFLPGMSAIVKIPCSTGAEHE